MFGFLFFPTRKQIQQDLLGWKEKIRGTWPLEEQERLKSRLESKLDDVQCEKRVGGTSEKLRFAGVSYKHLIDRVDKKISWIIYGMKVNLLKSYLLQRNPTEGEKYGSYSVPDSTVVDRMVSVSGAPQEIAQRVFETVNLMDIHAVQDELDSLEDMGEAELEDMSEAELGDVEGLGWGFGGFFEDDEDFWDEETKEKNFAFFEEWLAELDEAWSADRSRRERDTYDEILKIGMTDKAGEFLSFFQIAEMLPTKYPLSGENDLPTAKERARIVAVDRFYDFFQIIYLDEERAGSRKYIPKDPGWYWVTYFHPRPGWGHIGPFSDEHQALTHACSHALPLNDPRRKKYKYGYIGSDIEMCSTMFGRKEPF
jgi:hypothetical protein